MQLFSAPFFSRAADLAAAQKVFRSPELFQQVSGNPAVTALEKNPRFRAVVADPEVKEALERGDTVALLRSTSVHKLLQDPEALVQLARLRQAVDQVTEQQTSKPVAPRPDGLSERLMAMSTSATGPPRSASRTRPGRR